MRARLACADFTFPLLEHHASLQLIQLMGFRGVDIGLFEGRSHIQPSGEFADPVASGQRLERRLSNLGLEVADIFLQLDLDFVPFAINQPDDTRRLHAREQFLRALDYAAACGSRHVTALPGVRFPEESYRDSLDRAKEELAWRVERAQRLRLEFSVEPHVGSIVDTPHKARALARGVDGLTLTLDYTHFTRHGVPDEEIEPLVEHASHFHFRGARQDRLQASMAENTIDYKRVLTRMEEVGYPGWHAVEYVWSDWEHCNECDNVSETIILRDLIRRHCTR